MQYPHCYRLSWSSQNYLGYIYNQFVKDHFLTICEFSQKVYW